MERHLFGYRVGLDPEATRAWYRIGDRWDCGCGHCRNFLALARHRQLPGEVLEEPDKCRNGMATRHAVPEAVKNKGFWQPPKWDPLRWVPIWRGIPG